MSRSSLFGGIALIALCALPMATHAQRARTFTVTFEGLRNTDGLVRGALYDHTETWLDHAHPSDTCRASITGGRARCVFRHPPSGRVAFAGMHDEDRSGDLNRDAVGIPTEGYAFSNDVHPTVGPPSFESALLAEGATSCVVHVHYGL